MWAERNCKIMCKKLRARAHARTSDDSRQRVKHLLRGSLGRVLAPFYLAIIPPSNHDFRILVHLLQVWSSGCSEIAF